MSRSYEPNDGKHIDYIVRQTACKTHNAPQGSACWYVRYDSRPGVEGEALCDERVKSAGFNGYIQPGSLRQRNNSGGTYSRK